MRKQGGAGDQLHGVNFLHVTNFVRSQDRILLAYNDKLEEYILHWRDSRLGEERIEQPMKWAHYKTLNRYVLPQYGRTKIREFEANPWLAHKIVGSILDRAGTGRSRPAALLARLASRFGSTDAAPSPPAPLLP